MGDRIENGSWLRHGVTLEASPIGRASFVGFRAVLRHAVVGDGAQVAARARLEGSAQRPVLVGDGAWIGAGARIASGVRVGAHSIVGAGAEVTEDVPPNTISYGRPAFVRGEVATRFDQGDGIEEVLRFVRKRAKRDTTRLLVDGPPDPDSFFDCTVTLGQEVTIGRAAIMIGRPDGPSPQGGIVVGPRTCLGDRLIAEGVGGLSLGTGVTVCDRVTITTSTHDHRSPGRPWTAAPVDIAADAVIGAGAILVGPLRIGAGARVTPGAVVTRSIAPGATSKGVFG